MITSESLEYKENAIINRFFFRQKNTAKKILQYFSDLIEYWTYPKDVMIPPRRLHFVGDGDFIEVGRVYLKLFVDYGGLAPDDKVLDVGSGNGRIAVSLLDYMNKNGGYEGFDIVPRGVRWCQNRITSKFPDFRFQRVDIYNNTYNKRGKIKSSDFVFPYPDETFDFVILTSVFTHLLADDMEHYLKEIYRTMKTNGRCFITFFILNEVSQSCIDAGKSATVFNHELNGCRVYDIKNPEDAVAYDEKNIISLYERIGLDIKGSINYGNWSGRDFGYVSYQDFIVAEKISR